VAQVAVDYRAVTVVTAAQVTTAAQVDIRAVVAPTGLELLQQEQHRVIG
jgi:hypothetical protein